MNRNIGFNGGTSGAVSSKPMIPSIQTILQGSNGIVSGGGSSTLPTPGPERWQDSRTILTHAVSEKSVDAPLSPPMEASRSV